MLPLEGWITGIRVEPRIDEHDPHGCREAVQRQRPSKHVIRIFGLNADEPWQDIWRDHAKRAVFRSLAWGERKGHGEHETSNSGSALQCERMFLSELLSELNRDLIVVVKLQHFRERQPYEATRGESGDPFTYAYSVLSISGDLRVDQVVPTQRDFGVVEALTDSARYNFDNRFCALKKSSPMSRCQPPPDAE